MKNLHLLAAIAAALVLAACGGSSGSSNSASTSTTTTVVPTSTPRIEAIVNPLTTYDSGVQSLGVKFQYQDLATIQSLDQIQFQLVYYSATGTRVVLPTDQWTSSDTANSYGVLSYNSGLYVAGNAVTTSPLTVEVTYNNHNYFSYYDVVPRQVRERGKVQGDTSKVGLSGIEVDFYGFTDLSDNTPYAVTTALDAIGGSHTVYVFPTTVNTSALVFLGRTTTQADGTFRASIPAGTYGFTLLNSTLPSAYQRIFRYRGVLYNTGDTTPYGLAPIPAQAPIVIPPTVALPSPLPYPLGTYVSELPILNNYLPNGEYFLANYSNSNPDKNGTIELIPTSESVATPVN